MIYREGRSDLSHDKKMLILKITELEERVNDLLTANKLLSDFIEDEGLSDEFINQYAKLYFYRKLLKRQ